jgi:hypothetical protein
MTRLPLTVLLLAIFAGASGAQTPKGAHSGPAAPADSMKSLVTRDFELYAPSDGDLRGANDEIRVAVSQFGRYMGEHPKKTAFVLFRSAAEADRYDYRGFARRGLPVAPWILPAKPAGPAAPARAAGGAPPDPLSHEAGHRFLITYTDHALAAARAAGLLPPDSGAAPAGRVSSPGRVAQSGGHAGHPAIPDWLEEAIASLCERPSNQRVRIEYLCARLDRSIPMERFLAMARPAGAGPGGAKAAKAGGSGGKSGTATGAGKAKGAAAAAAGGAEAESLAIFCAQALSLARFIADREDDRFIGTITEGVLRGRTVGDVLNTSQNVHSKPEALEEQWRAWMQNVPRVP